MLKTAWVLLFASLQLGSALAQVQLPSPLTTPDMDQAAVITQQQAVQAKLQGWLQQNAVSWDPTQGSLEQWQALSAQQQAELGFLLLALKQGEYALKELELRALPDEEKTKQAALVYNRLLFVRDFMHLIPLQKKFAAVLNAKVAEQHESHFYLATAAFPMTAVWLGYALVRDLQTDRMNKVIRGLSHSSGPVAQEARHSSNTSNALGRASKLARSMLANLPANQVAILTEHMSHRAAILDATLQALRALATQAGTVESGQWLSNFGNALNTIAIREAGAADSAVARSIFADIGIAGDMSSDRLRQDLQYYIGQADEGLNTTRLSIEWLQHRVKPVLQQPNIDFLALQKALGPNQKLSGAVHHAMQSYPKSVQVSADRLYDLQKFCRGEKRYIMNTRLLLGSLAALTAAQLYFFLIKGNDDEQELKAQNAKSLELVASLQSPHTDWLHGFSDSEYAMDAQLAHTFDLLQQLGADQFTDFPASIADTIPILTTPN